MKYTRTQFTKEYYNLWEVGLLLPDAQNDSVYSVKYKTSQCAGYSRVTLKATSISDALERACYAVTYASPWRPENIELIAVYNKDENLLWIDESYYNQVQNHGDFRGVERREFILKFGAASAAILFGLRPSQTHAASTTISMNGTASGFSGEQLYTTAGSYSWTVPIGVTSVSVVCVGGGGNGSTTNGGGAGGALAYKNTISTTPGSVMTVNVGGSGQASTFSTVTANGGNAGGGTYTSAIGGTYSGADGGGNGGAGGQGNGGCGGGAGGAGGYAGAGGAGSPTPSTSGLPGNGGGGGGGSSPSAGGCGGAGGGGVGLYGQGANGAGGPASGNEGGKGGSNGSGASYSVNIGTSGGAYGGGGGGGYSYSGFLAGNGASGAVRIIWGTGRSFPSNAS